LGSCSKISSHVGAAYTSPWSLAASICIPVYILVPQDWAIKLRGYWSDFHHWTSSSESGPLIYPPDQEWQEGLDWWLGDYFHPMGHAFLYGVPGGANTFVNPQVLRIGYLSWDLFWALYRLLAYCRIVYISLQYSCIVGGSSEGLIVLRRYPIQLSFVWIFYLFSNGFIPRAPQLWLISPEDYRHAGSPSACLSSLLSHRHLCIMGGGVVLVANQVHSPTHQPVR
jgi:hypothetical protein